MAAKKTPPKIPNYRKISERYKKKTDKEFNDEFTLFFNDIKSRTKKVRPDLILVRPKVKLEHAREQSFNICLASKITNRLMQISVPGKNGMNKIETLTNPDSGYSFKSHHTIQGLMEWVVNLPKK
jgi:hypothetical protein